MTIYQANQKLLADGLFEEISRQLEFLKLNLPKDQYENNLKLLENEIGEDLFSRLLTIRVVENKKKGGL